MRIIRRNFHVVSDDYFAFQRRGGKALRYVKILAAGLRARLESRPLAEQTWRGVDSLTLESR